MSRYGLRVGRSLSLAGSFFTTEGDSAVSLNHAKIEGLLDLEGTSVIGHLNMNSLTVGASVFMRTTNFNSVDLVAAKIEGHLSLDDATVTGHLNMNSLTVGASVSMSATEHYSAASFNSVELTAAKIEGHLSLDGATVTGHLHMSSLTVGASVSMSATEQYPAASFNSVYLGGAKIEGELGLGGATVTGHLNMNSLTVGGSVFLQATQYQASFNSVDLAGAKIEGQLSLMGATVTGHLKMNSLTVGANVLMEATDQHPANFNSVDLTFASIKQNLELWNATFNELDLTSTRIEGQLRLGFSDRSSEGSLIMYNTHANTVQDWWNEGDWKKNPREVRDCWPKHLELDGFTYNHLHESAGQDKLRRPVEWYIQWLERDQPYSPGRYEQLANVLRKAGEPNKADAILYESREQARKRARTEEPRIVTVPRAGLTLSIPARGRFVGLTVLNWTIGYGLGLRYFRSLLWVIGLTVLGVVVLFWSGEWHVPGTLFGFGPWPVSGEKSAGVLAAIIYSLQTLLPFTEMQKFENVHLTGFAEGYFLVHRLLGYALAAFLAAGVAGLTQKS